MENTVVIKEDFDCYEAVRESGLTNMFDTRKVNELSGLDREQILYIIKHYNELKERWGEDVQR